MSSHVFQALVCCILFFLDLSAADYFWKSSKSNTFCFWMNSISDGDTHYMFLHQTAEDDKTSLFLFDSIWSKDRTLVECIMSSDQIFTESYASMCWEAAGKLFSGTPNELFNISKLVEPTGPCLAVGRLDGRKASVRLTRDIRSVDSKTIHQVSKENSQKRRRSKRAWMIPGTLWCGSGNKALTFSDLGLFEETDKCCREHDHCKESIPSFEFGYGVFNTNIFTLSHCDCDNKFRRCLHSNNETISDVVGYGYFNILKMRCFELSQTMRCAKRTWWGMCTLSQLTLYASLKYSTTYNSTFPELEEEPSIHHTITVEDLSGKADLAMSSNVLTDDNKEGQSVSVTQEMSSIPQYTNLSRKTTGLSQTQTDSSQTVSGIIKTKTTDSLLTQTDSAQTQTDLPSAQSGTTQTQTGSAQTHTALPHTQSGTKQTHTDLPHTQSGTTQTQTGLPHTQFGTTQTQPGLPHTQFGTTQTQPGSAQTQTGLPHTQSGTKQTHIDLPHTQSGTKQTQTGSAQTQTGSVQTQTGSVQTQTGSAQTQTGSVQTQTGLPHTQSGTKQTHTGSPQTQTDSPLIQISSPQTLSDVKDTQTIDSTQMSASPVPSLHLESHTTQKDKVKTCEGYKLLDSCHHLIPGKQEKYGLHNAAHTTLYHCNCTARLAEEFAEQEVDKVHLLLLDFVSQSCFVLPQNCADGKSCSSSSFTEPLVIKRWTKDVAVWRHLVATKRKSRPFNTRRTKRKETSFRLYKKCVRMHSKLHKPLTLKKKVLLAALQQPV